MKEDTVKDDIVKDEPTVIASGPDTKKPGFFKTKKGKGLLLGLGAVAVFGAGVGATFLIMNMNNSSQETVASKDEKKDEKKAEKKETEEKISTAEAVKAIDLSKPINGVKGATYANATEGNPKASLFGVSVSVNADKTSGTININGAEISKYIDDWTGAGGDFKVVGFSGKIKNAIVGEIGQTFSAPLPIFYLMEDGTVEYNAVLKNSSDKYGHTWIDVNYSDDYDKDGRATGDSYFKSAGKISGVNDVVKLYVADLEMNVGGGRTTLAAKADGSFYDLGALLGL